MVVRKCNLPAVVGDNSLSAYLDKIKTFPVLSEEQENSLLQDLHRHGDMRAAQVLVTSHLRLAAKIAMTYRNYGLPMSDIISEANIGLMQAVKKFDVTKKVRLATYAVWWIKAAINDYILRSWSLVKIGTSAAQKKLFYNLKRIKARLGLYDNKALAPQEVKAIARELVVDEADVKEMNGRLSGDTSLNVAISDDDDSGERIDMLVDKSQNIEERLALAQENAYKTAVMRQCLAQLSEREQYVIKNRLLTSTPKTLGEMGEELGVSRERIRQIEEASIKKLKELVLLAISVKK
ncbi:MAG: RNA polymerase factor sigma-32 [Alphaproteobacteria bacterium]|nr:RNA polymerase factor sigma-32 [Alphaproteobacteria bacterium]MBQ9234839.1 RNA polymerase factor sigma-32 [Alphaproteobacteria bacterium]